jgi:flagellar motor switch protein FliN
LYKNAIYSSKQDWINLFSMQKFNISNSYNIEALPLYKKIIFAKKKINLEQYTKLVKGNVLIFNQSLFSLDGLATLNFDSFLMHVRYDDDQLFFESWSQNMSNNKQELDDESWDEDGKAQDKELYQYGANEDEGEDYDDESSDEFDLDNEPEENNNNEEDEDSEDNNEEENEQEDENSSELIEEVPKHPFANIPVQLSFSLGHIKLPIESIMQLSEGSILELHKNTPAQVIIYANGKEIGTAEVVDINGKLGVQIIELH